MNHYTIKLKKREVVAKQTMAFFFQKPKRFKFKAGQYIDMTIPQRLDASNPENIRSFSIASAPFEQHLMVAMRMRKSAFKQALRSLPIGESVRIQGPLGEFTLPNQTKRPLVFLAGGIGITPFLSMLIQAAHEKRRQQFFLFYSNRTRKDGAFLQELMSLAKRGLSLTIIPVFTQEGQGYIDKTLLTSNIPDISLPVYYIAGPPAMVGAMAQLLTHLRINRDNIKIEEFSGY